jgi:hypothetical protein
MDKYVELSIGWALQTGPVLCAYKNTETQNATAVLPADAVASPHRWFKALS